MAPKKKAITRVIRIDPNWAILEEFEISSPRSWAVVNSVMIPVKAINPAARPVINPRDPINMNHNDRLPPSFRNQGAAIINAAEQLRRTQNNPAVPVTPRLGTV